MWVSRPIREAPAVRPTDNGVARRAVMATDTSSCARWCDAEVRHDTAVMVTDISPVFPMVSSAVTTSR